MKYLLLFPPTWAPSTPHLAIPSLLGQLKKEGFEAEGIDLNIEFYNDILKKSYLKKSVKNLKKIQIETSIEAQKYDINNKKIEDYPIEIQEILLKDNAIKEYLSNKSELLKTIPAEVEKAVSNIKNPKKFYDPVTYLNSFKVIHSALDIASLPYSPAKVLFYNYENPLFHSNYKNLKYNVFSKSTNIFIEYFEKWLPTIKKKNPQYIGISIGSNTQMVAGLTLANLLKKHTNAHINIGGNHISRIADGIIKFPEFFDLFADSLSIDEGLKPIVELAKYIDNRISIEEVPNLIYKKNNEIITNKKCTHLKLNETATSSYDGFDFSKYLAPNIILPIQTTSGCYWNKCAFCDIAYGKEYNVKDLDKLINELKEYKKKFGVTNFEIIDESIPPKYFEKMAEKIIENKLDINYQAYTRTEQAFTKEIFEKMRKSGLRVLYWGIESGSKRVMELINKGIDFDNRIDILKESSNADIWNHGFAFFGFPSERIDEAKETIETLCRNSDIIDSCGVGFFQLGKHSKIKENPDYYEIIIKPEQEELSTILDFEAKGMSHQELDSILQLHNEAKQKAYGSSFWKYCNCPQDLFLYVVQYGVNKVKNYKLSDLKNKRM